jgi:hypothetical protein
VQLSKLCTALQMQTLHGFAKGVHQEEEDRMEGDWQSILGFHVGQQRRA